MEPESVLVVEAREEWHITLRRRYKESWFDAHFRFSTPAAIVLFAVSIMANFYAGAYATKTASNPVTDIILSNTPVFDVDFFFIYGALAFIAIIVVLCLWHPKRIPFTLHALSLFYFIRAAFVSMTHLASFPDQAAIDTWNFASKLLGEGLFFSGHTGAPFLMALMYWHKPRLRYLFLALSAFFGVIVLLGHLHYTIDVLSAFFITYGVYHIALWIFPKERALFLADELQESTSSSL